MAAARKHVHIAGRVQGVFFRASAAREAERLGLGGWVRNLPDGRVEAVVEGDEAAVAAWLAWAHRGPPHARVDRLDAVDEEPRGEAKEFRVR